jgi:hypothetical protein
MRLGRRFSEVALPGADGDGDLLGEVADRDDAAVDQEEGPFTAVGDEPDRAADGRRAVPPFGPEAAFALPQRWLEDGAAAEAVAPDPDSPPPQASWEPPSRRIVVSVLPSCWRILKRPPKKAALCTVSKAVALAIRALPWVASRTEPIGIDSSSVIGRKRFSPGSITLTMPTFGSIVTVAPLIGSMPLAVAARAPTPEARAITGRAIGITGFGSRFGFGRFGFAEAGGEFGGRRVGAAGRGRGDELRPGRQRFQRVGFEGRLPGRVGGQREAAEKSPSLTARGAGFTGEKLEGVGRVGFAGEGPLDDRAFFGGREPGQQPGQFGARRRAAARRSPGRRCGCRPPSRRRRAQPAGCRRRRSRPPGPLPRSRGPSSRRSPAAR